MVARWKPSMERSKKETQITEEKGKENKRLQSLLLEHVAEKPRSLPTEAVMPSSSDNTNPKTGE